MTKIEQLQRRIAELEAEKQNWLDEKVFTVQQIVQKEPEDYPLLKQRVKELERENRKLEKIIRYGSISSVAGLIDDFEISAKKSLGKLSAELNFYFMNTEERDALKKFIAYLQFVEHELQQFLMEGDGNEN